MADRNGNHALSLFKLDFSVKELLGFAEIGGEGSPRFPRGIGSRIDLSGSDHKDRETY